MKFIRKFLRSERGAVTTDWVVLTAGIVGLAGASTFLINDGVVSLSDAIGENVDSQAVGQIN